MSRLLTPASRGRASVQQHEPLATATDDGAPGKKLTKAKAHSECSRAGDLRNSESPSPVSADAAGEHETIVFSPQDHVNDFSDDLAGRSPEESNGEAPAATSAPAESMTESLPVSAAPQQNPAPLPFATVTSLDNLTGIAPIAEALIKTLAGKARTGRLDELKALELLQQAVLL